MMVIMVNQSSHFKVGGVGKRRKPGTPLKAATHVIKLLIGSGQYKHRLGDQSRQHTVKNRRTCRSISSRFPFDQVKPSSLLEDP